MEPLVSERCTHVNRHFYHDYQAFDLNFHNNMSLTVVQKPTLSLAAPFKPPLRPFPLMLLPLELRIQIYTHYFGFWEVTLDYERLTMLRSKFHVSGVPSVSLLLVCQRVYHETQALRLRQFNGRLNLNSVFILVPLRRKERFEWLRQNVRTLHFGDSSVHPERWNRYYDNFPNLERLEIEFPHVVRLDGRCGLLEEVLGGFCDEVLLESLDVFRLALVDQLSDMVKVVVSQRYCLGEQLTGWRGVLDVQIELSRTGTQIIERNHDDGVSVVSKREFRRPSEL